MTIRLTKTDVYRVLIENLVGDSGYAAYAAQVTANIDALLANCGNGPADCGRRRDPVDAASEWLSNPGKGSRVVLLSELLTVCGVSLEDRRNAFYVASIVECAHNLSLVVDDAIDQDLIRRGKPTIYAVGGTRLVREVAHELVDLLFRLVARIDAQPEALHMTCGMLVEASSNLRRSILQEKRYEDGATYRTLDDGEVLARSVYMAKSFGLVHVGIEVLRQYYDLQSTVVDVFLNLVAEIGIFLQSVNDVENYSLTKSCGSVNVDRFSDIRCHRLTLLLASEIAKGDFALERLTCSAFSSGATNREYRDLATHILSSGLIERELQRLTTERNRLLRIIGETHHFSSEVSATLSAVVDEYFAVLSHYRF